MENFDIVILGGGASGLFCANQLSEKYKIAIIEKENKVGKKILATGNGRCNITNLNLSSTFYNQNIDNYLQAFNNIDTINYFKELGLLIYNDEEGRCYPISNSAASVLDILRLNLNKNINIFLEKNILNIVKNKKTDNFIINFDNNDKIATKYLIYACGGNTFHLVENLHKDTIKCKKSLVSLQTKNANKYLNGVRINNILATMKINNQTYCEKGEILFKDNAVSGIMIFNLSSHMARINNYQQKITLDLLPNIEYKELINILNIRKLNKNLKGENFLNGIFHSAMCKNILEKINFDTKNVENIAKIIKNYDIFTKKPLDNNQVHSGGINLNSLTKNLESKETKNLFCIGEGVDVDGICGGYNLQWAWTSGAIVAQTLNEL